MRFALSVYEQVIFYDLYRYGIDPKTRFKDVLRGLDRNTVLAVCKLIREYHEGVINDG